MICCCKKNFFHEKHGLLFEKDKYYIYRYENNREYIWVVYDENGESTKQGIRFHLDKKKERIVQLVYFYKFFYKDRKAKLLKLKTFFNE